MNQVVSLTQSRTYDIRSATSDLARRSRQTRILVDATRDFTYKARPSTRDIAAYKEMFYQLIDRILPADRRLLSTLLARASFTPRAVAIYLATDTIDIAIPFLLYSPVLDVIDLENIAAKKGERYADVIARRQVRTDEPARPADDAARTAHQQQEVHGTHAKAEPAAARDKPPVAEPVAVPDAPLDALLDAPLDASGEAASKILHTPSLAPEVLAPEMTPEGPAAEPIRPVMAERAPDTDVAEAEPVLPPVSAPADAVLALAGIGGRLGRDQAPPRDNTASDHPDRSQPADRPGRRRYDRLPKRETGQLLDLARNRDRKGLAETMSALSGLEIAAVNALLASETGDEVIYFIKALAPEPPRDLQLLLTAAPRFGRGTERYQAAKALLNELDTGICRMIFNQIGAKFDLPQLQTLKAPGATGAAGLSASDNARASGNTSETEFADRVRERRMAISSERYPTPSERKAPVPSATPIPGPVPGFAPGPFQSSVPNRNAASHRDFRDLFQENVVVNFG